MDSEVKKEPSKYIQDMEAHILRCKEASDYSIKRFDVLIITLSSSGLALSLAFIKDLIKTLSSGNFLLFKISTIFFAVSIICNLLSQKTSFYSHSIEIKVSKLLILKKQQKSVCSNCEGRLDFRAKFLNISTTILNFTSLVLLISAIILIMVFILKFNK